MTEFESRDLRNLSILEQQFPELRQKTFYKCMHSHFLMRLHQFGLSGRCQPVEVMAEVIYRLHYAFISGKTISNLEAWARKTGFNFIYELSRNEKKYQFVDDITLESLIGISNSTQVWWENEKDYTELYKALQSLNKSEKEILEMRFFQFLSWEQIAQILKGRGESVPKVTLRKRGQRALENLRIIFLESLDI